MSNKKTAGQNRPHYFLSDFFKQAQIAFLLYKFIIIIGHHMLIQLDLFIVYDKVIKPVFFKKSFVIAPAGYNAVIFLYIILFSVIALNEKLRARINKRMKALIFHICAVFIAVLSTRLSFSGSNISQKSSRISYAVTACSG